MRGLSLLAATTTIVTVAASGTAGAAALSCRSVNGNVVCAGPGAASCQTVDGKTVCTSGKGDVHQIFGAPGPDHPDPSEAEPDLGGDEAGEPDVLPPVPPDPGRLVIERRGPGGRALSLWRDGHRLRIDTGRLILDVR